MATSVPVPIARPRSAVASAAASLTPSPTIATRAPSRCSRSTTATLSAGRTWATTSVDPDLAGGRPGRALVVAGEQDRPQAERPQLGDRLRGRRLHRVAQHQHAAGRAVPGDHDGGGAVGLGRVDGVLERRRVDALVAQPGGLADEDASTQPDARVRGADDAGDAVARLGAEVVHLVGADDDAVATGRTVLLDDGSRDRPPDRVLGQLLDGRGVPQHLVVADARRRAPSAPR